MSDAPLSPLVSVDLMPDILAGVNAILRENSSEAQDFITNNNSRDSASESSTMQNQDLIPTSPRPRRLPQLQLKLPVLSSSSSDSDGDDISRPPIGGDGLLTDNSNRTTSPPPNCAICLSRCKNKCFTDSCMHQFCFKCLCEWSKVKPECPLCKQTFKSIIHNVKSIDQFEEYHVQAPTVELPAPSFDLESFGLLSYGNRYVIVPPHLDFPRNRSSMVFTSDPSSSSSRNTENNNPFDTARVTRAYPIALLDDYYRRHPDSIGDEGISHLWRTYIYDRKLYALPVCDITGRFRESSARFYRDNPAQVHRLMPWIRRDIDCLVDGVLIQRDDVIQSIAEALTIMNILSSAFRRRIQPYLGTKTAHFIHELNNFARSPYDMIGYDRTVRYSPQIQEEIVIEFSLSESSDTEDNVTTDLRSRATVAPTLTSTVTSESHAIVNAINLSIHDRANVVPNIRDIGRRSGTNSGIIDLGDESDNNNDPTASTSRQEIFQQQQQQPLQPFQGANNEQILISRSPPITDNIELSSASSDCEFVLERKPPHLRTPEMVSLDSATDSDVVFVDEVKPLNKISFNTTDDEEEIVNNENDDAGISLTNATAMGINDTIVTGGGASTGGNSEIASGSNYRNKNKQQQHSQNCVGHHCQEMYNVGASTSSGLRNTASMRSKRHGLLHHDMHNMRYNQRQRQRCSRRDNNTTPTRNDSFRRLRRNKSGRLEKSFNSPDTTTSITSRGSSPSSTSSTSVTKIFPLSTTTDFSSLLSSSSSDEDFQPSFARKRRNNNKNSKQRSVSVVEKRPAKRNMRKRRMVKRKSRRSNGRIRIDDVTNNNNNNNKCEQFTDDSESNDSGNSHHVAKNSTLLMALGDKKEQKRKETETERQETNKKERPRRKRKRSLSMEQTDVENAWRSEAVNEPLKKKQLCQARNSYKMAQRQQETQRDVLNNQRHKLSTVVNVIENCATGSNANNEQSTSHSSKCRETSKNNNQRKQNKRGEHQQQTQLGENLIKRECISNDDDDDDDDDDIDNLYLSVLKSILKAERSTSLNGGTNNQTSAETVVDENVVRNDTDNGNGNMPEDEVKTHPEVHQENEIIPPPLSPSSSSQMPLQRLFQDNERDESNSTNTIIGEIEVLRSGINDTDEPLSNLQRVQDDGDEKIMAPILNRNVISTVTPQSAIVAGGTLQITVTSSNVTETTSDVHIRVDATNININSIHNNNNNDSNNNNNIIIRNNNREFSALSSSPSTSSLLSTTSSSSTAYEEECPVDRLLEADYVEDFRNGHYGNNDRNNEYPHNNDYHHDPNDDDDDNHSNSSTISTGSISSTTTTDTASNTTENDLSGAFH